MELTREKALELHRKMWSDMRKELGDNPGEEERWNFRYNWIRDWRMKTGCKTIRRCCFLYEYSHGRCETCPIDWSKAEGIDLTWKHVDCSDRFKQSGLPYLKSAPISLILAIPEREEEIIEDLL